MTLGPAIPQAGADWTVAVASQEEEFPAPVAVPAEGALPPELVGTLYLVGPARHDVYGSTAGSLFDGDGMVHAVRLGGPGAAPTYQRRFVATDKKQAEDRARRRLYGTFASTAPGGAWAKAVRSRPRSTANAGVLFHQGRLFALWDGAAPWELDPSSLETIGQCRFDGVLGRKDGFASSPVVDPATGDVWNLGGRPRRRLWLGLYHWPADGPLRLVGRARLPYRSVVRTLALTPRFAVFAMAPLVPRVSAAAALGRVAPAEVLSWRPELGAVVGVAERATGRFRFVPMEAALVSAVAQAFEDGDDLVVDVTTFPSPDVLGAATDVVQGTLSAKGYATLERLVVRAGGSGNVERSLLPPLDWPALAAGAAGGPGARLYGMNLNPVAGFPGTLAAVDVDPDARRVQWVPPLANEVAGPPCPVAKAGGAGGAGGPGAWVLSVVTDLAARRSEVRVYDGDDLKAPPVFRAVLPAVVPFGARGTFAPAG